MEPKQVFNKQIIASFANAAMLAQAVNALRCKPVTNSLEAITSEAIVLRRFNQRLFIFFVIFPLLFKNKAPVSRTRCCRYC